MDTETEPDLAAPEKQQQLAGAFWLHVPDWVTGEATPEARGRAVQLPTHRIKTTSIYCYRVTWKGKEAALKHCHCSSLLPFGVQFRAWWCHWPKLEAGDSLSAVLNLATSRVCDVCSACNVHLSCIFVSFGAFPTQHGPSSPLTTCFSFSTVLQPWVSHKMSSWLALVVQGGAGHVCNIYERKYDIKLVPNIECTFIWYWNNFACEHGGVTPGQTWCQSLGQGVAQHSSSTCRWPKLCFHTESNSGTHEAKTFIVF